MRLANPRNKVLYRAAFWYCTYNRSVGARLTGGIFFQEVFERYRYSGNRMNIENARIFKNIYDETTGTLVPARDKESGLLECLGKVGFVTHYRPAMPLGNRTKYFTGSFQLSIVMIKKLSLPANLKFNYLDIFQSLKLRISMGKSPFNFS